MEQPTGSSSSSLNFRALSLNFKALLDSHVKDRLPIEVKEGLTNLFVKFHQEINACFVLGLEHLLINVSNLLPSSTNKQSEVGCATETGPPNAEMRTRLLSNSASNGLGNPEQIFSEKQTSSVAPTSEKASHPQLIHEGEGEHEGHPMLLNSSTPTSPNVFLQPGQELLLISKDVPPMKRRKLNDIKESANKEQGSLSDKSPHPCSDPCAQNSLLVREEIAKVNDIFVDPQVHAIQTRAQAGASNMAISVSNDQNQSKEDHFVSPLAHAISSQAQAVTSYHIEYDFSFNFEYIPFFVLTQEIYSSVICFAFFVYIIWRHKIFYSHCFVRTPGNQLQRKFTLQCLNGPLDPRLRALYEYNPSFSLGIDLGEEEPFKNNGKSKAIDNGYPTCFVTSHSTRAGPISTVANHMPPTVDLGSDDDVQIIISSSKPVQAAHDVLLRR